MIMHVPKSGQQNGGRHPGTWQDAALSLRNHGLWTVRGGAVLSAGPNILLLMFVLWNVVQGDYLVFFLVAFNSPPSTVWTVWVG